MATPESRIAETHKSGMAKKLAGGALSYGFIGVDSYMRMKDGESAPVAVGKAVLTNAAFSLLPGGIIGAVALGGIMAAPAMASEMNRAARGMNGQKQMFHNNFQETTSQVNMLQTGMSRMNDSRTQLTRQMANHARGAAKAY